MNLYATLCLRQLLMLILMVTFSTSLIAGAAITYASPMGNERWQMSGNRLRCSLSLPIPNYGVAYFEQYAARKPHFIMSKWDQVERRIRANVSVLPPVWKPDGQIFRVGEATISPGKFALVLGRDQTLKLLTYLSLGFQSRFQYTSEQGFLTTVALSPIRFRASYSTYQRCLSNLLPFSFQDVQESVFYFAVNQDDLSDKDKMQLRRIAEYAQADENIQSIYIAGYTDDMGRKSYNNAISEERAKAVRKYLLKVGAPRHLLAVTWFGLKDPIQPNDTELGRAANRRVVVIIKKAI